MGPGEAVSGHSSHVRERQMAGVNLHDGPTKTGASDNAGAAWKGVSAKLSIKIKGQRTSRRDCAICLSV